MRRIRQILAVLLLCAALPSGAQMYFRGGYDAGYYNMNNLDLLVANYTGSRPWLDDPLDEIHLMHGPQFGLGWRFQNFAAEARWTGHYAIVSATGTPPSGGTEIRYLRARDGIVSLEGRYHPRDSRFGFGISADVTYFQTLTRLASVNHYTHFERTVAGGLTFSAGFLPLKKIFNPGITFYYHQAIGKNEIDHLWYYMDKQSYTSLTRDYFKVSTSHFGMAFVILIRNKKDED